ncbi:coiled-coil domain-containing protein [Clostridium botulinum]|uniref:Phage morphogeneis protein n=1 Tax=Clostridium botulinum TaxID=1491 RepID=A0A9Q1UWU2_CLOBO|nr:phage morphogeneis protein [Clostridium botulinum]AEB77387.1 phage virion protein [Clostridium botulinum BKT015925]KEH96375.1 phage morphogeneis protein [Clostridium botulinum C/D str. Sp77]KLU74480.1 phage virion protein [Clostridium botulinum V891]KOA75523.1 phage morphogeneis protein [Clostridium botulinum]KOA77628.1 phage morphogeneis protein [Clostridium botulinum]
MAENQEQKKSIFKAQFNSIEINQEDPTLLKGTVIIHDFGKSWNNQIISEEVCAENMNTLIGKRIVCKYISNEENNGIDALGEHEEKEGKNRNGKDVVITDTIAIGFIENVYIDDFTDENGNIKRVLYGDVVIWNDDKYQDVTGLLMEWLNNGVKIHMSVEFLYCNYNMIDGIEHIQSPILYTAHTLLNSEDRGDCIEIEPAYDSAQLLSLNEKKTWNKAINQVIKKQNNSTNKEDEIVENAFIKSLNSISLGDIRSKIMDALSKVMTADEYWNVWVSNYDIYPTENYFVYETCENDEWVNYKVSYTMENENITISYDEKVQVKHSDDWVAISEVQKSTNALKEKETELKTANDKIGELEKQLNSKEDTIKSLNSKVTSKQEEDQSTVKKFNELTNTLTSLNAKVKEMQPIVDKYHEEQYQKQLNSATTYYKEKFESVDALEDFEKEDVQNLIKQSINSKEDEAEKAKFSLNNMIVSKILPIQSDDKVTAEPKLSINSINEPCTNNENLNKSVDEFEEFYGFKK